MVHVHPKQNSIINRYDCKTIFLRLGDNTNPLLSFGHWILWEILPLTFLHFKSIPVKGLESCQMRHNKGNSKYFTLRKRTWGASVVVFSRLRGCLLEEGHSGQRLTAQAVLREGEGSNQVPSDPLLWELRRQFLQGVRFGWDAFCLSNSWHTVKLCTLSLI